MTNNEKMVFDANCGISEEEQREILAHINGIAEKNRRSLASGAADTPDQTDGAGEKSGKVRKWFPKPGFKAQKSGGLFPIAVNAAAILALAGGLIALYAFQGKTNVQVREGTKVYNSAERALIEEIRRETSSRLEAKESEISLIASKLADIDAELQGLQSGSQEENRLRALQDEYRASLFNLQDERSQILEEARMREANLQAQLESRTRELDLVSRQSAAAIDSAFEEMDRLSREQAQAASVEAQMGAFFANLNGAINNNRLDEAAEIVKSMRNFLNTPAFQGLRSIQARKELYTQAINSFETMILALSSGELSLDTASQQLLADLQEQNTRLQRDVEVYSSGAGGMAQEIRSLQDSNDVLRNLNTTLEAKSNEQDTQIRTKDNQIRTIELENSRLIQTVESRENTINRIQNIVRLEPGMTFDDITFGAARDSLNRIQEALGQ